MTAVHYWVILVVGIAAAGLVGWSHERIRAERAWALYRAHLRGQTVSAGQVWVVNDRPLYVIRTDADGVRWSVKHPLDDDYVPQFASRYETWRDWHRRLNHSDMLLTTRDWGTEGDR